jgi:hypothetical protein
MTEVKKLMELDLISAAAQIFNILCDRERRSFLLGQVKAQAQALLDLMQKVRCWI